MAIDLVCGMIVEEKSTPAKTTHEEADFSFCATYCKEAFERECSTVRDYYRGGVQRRRRKDKGC